LRRGKRKRIRTARFAEKRGETGTSCPVLFWHGKKGKEKEIRALNRFWSTEGEKRKKGKGKSRLCDCPWKTGLDQNKISNECRSSGRARKKVWGKRAKHVPIFGIKRKKNSRSCNLYAPRTNTTQGEGENQASIPLLKPTPERGEKKRKKRGQARAFRTNTILGERRKEKKQGRRRKREIKPRVKSGIVSFSAKPAFGAWGKKAWAISENSPMAPWGWGEKKGEKPPYHQMLDVRRKQGEKKRRTQTNWPRFARSTKERGGATKIGTVFEEKRKKGENGIYDDRAARKKKESFRSGIPGRRVKKKKEKKKEIYRHFGGRVDQIGPARIRERGRKKKTKPERPGRMLQWEKDL